jgi:predicted metal-binding protein/DNA-directed RNA polymerase subunit RPC12/RpoP
MSPNDGLKSSGTDCTADDFPQIYICPDCGGEVVLWTEQQRGKCLDCGRISRNENLQSANETNLKLKALIRFACSSGASEAKIISPDALTVENGLAELCRKSSCGNYGSSPGCPPHVVGPQGFRELQQKLRYALALRISVPSAALFSDERKEIMQRLQKITAGIEQAAVGVGYSGSKAFAGGSCKELFCYDRENCPVLSKGTQCRHPQYARPSLSGFGVNVSELMKICGWPADITLSSSDKDKDSMAWVAGLILIG